ncbi:hypothetical protein CA85_48380 [Allorhodopirellula solitaria]|uniref:Uncharacterized protein n=1 Tax=Allorhodopirellula solitaria TaxID=2527987 RepID=A0A5C5WXF8_9BACT|nr:hypothetical protein CA85_48380 [Allorhodopirellula solitaria]
MQYRQQFPAAPRYWVDRRHVNCDGWFLEGVIGAAAAIVGIERVNFTKLEPAERKNTDFRDSRSAPVASHSPGIAFPTPQRSTR